MNWFHRHEFDPEEWKLIRENEVYGDGWGGLTELPTRIDLLYKNTCETCGDLVFRKVSA